LEGNVEVVAELLFRAHEIYQLVSDGARLNGTQTNPELMGVFADPPEKSCKRSTLIQTYSIVADMDSGQYYLAKATAD
jgi:hypothetical protein